MRTTLDDSKDELIAKAAELASSVSGSLTTASDLVSNLGRWLSLIVLGAAFLIGCDLVARTFFAPIELPVGLITALIGGPFFLWLLVRQS
mgnify:CR=1 FL=1